MIFPTDVPPWYSSVSEDTTASLGTRPLWILARPNGTPAVMTQLPIGCRLPGHPSYLPPPSLHLPQRKHSGGPHPLYLPAPPEAQELLAQNVLDLPSLCWCPWLAPDVGGRVRWVSQQSAFDSEVPLGVIVCPSDAHPMGFRSHEFIDGSAPQTHWQSLVCHFVA